MDLQGQNGLVATYREGWRNRNPIGIAVSALLISFYLVLYFGSDLHIPLDFDEVAQSIGLRNRWFLYGALYSVAMVAGGAFYLRRHGNSRYNQIRIAVNVSVQIVLAFLVPFVFEPEFYFSYLWPLDFYKLEPGTLRSLPTILALYAVIASLVAAPLLAVFFGKRWYCSWVCGCGGLANTFGDPWRHLTSKSTQSWRFERWSIHIVLVIAVVSTAMLGLDALIGHDHAQFHEFVAGGSWNLKRAYTFVVGSILAGVVGTGLYPIFGPRVWCRNFCPMAAILGMAQKLGRYRIRVKPDMCISCGNCSTYCEMGIDVRSYAQNNESFTRASCVGCGMCAHMCPRGVLKLENEAPMNAEKKRTALKVVNF